MSEVLDDLDRRFPGIRFRMVDEQNRLRQHMNVWIGQDPVTDLAAPVDGRRRDHDHAGAQRRLS